jgi:hypothetical protein
LHGLGHAFTAERYWRLRIGEVVVFGNVLDLGFVLGLALNILAPKPPESKSRPCNITIATQIVAVASITNHCDKRHLRVSNHGDERRAGFRFGMVFPLN